MQASLYKAYDKLAIEVKGYGTISQDEYTKRRNLIINDLQQYLGRLDIGPVQEFLNSGRSRKQLLYNITTDKSTVAIDIMHIFSLFTYLRELNLSIDTSIVYSS